MKPFKSLILGLREAAQLLREHPEQYDWYKAESCNCGILARCLLNFDGAALAAQIIGQSGSWTRAAKEAFCPVTGLPVIDIFKQLSAAGLDQRDFAEIEIFHVCDFAGHRSAKHVANHFDSLADQLEERRKNGERP